MNTLYYHICWSLTCSISRMSYSHFAYCISTSFIQLYLSPELPWNTLTSANLIFSQKPKLLAVVYFFKRTKGSKNFFFRLHKNICPTRHFIWEVWLSPMAVFLFGLYIPVRKKRRLEIYQNLMTSPLVAMMQHSSRHLMQKW